MLLGFVVKVIGLILLAFFCLLFLLLCLVLLVPIRYEASGYKKKEETPEMACRGDLHWLFHLVQLHAGIYGKTKQVDVRILWLHPFSPRTKRAKSEEKQEKESEEKQQMGRETESEEKRATERETESEEKQEMKHETVPRRSETLKKREIVTAVEETAPKHETVATDGTEEVQPKAGPAASTAEEKKEELPAEPHENKKIKDAPQQKAEKKSFTDKIKKIFESLPDKIKGLCEKGSTLQALITDEENQEAMRLLLSRVQYLLRHLGFRKLEGELTAGVDDPAMMGRIMGVASLFYPLFSDSFCITPVFDHTVCEGRFELKGHIRLIHIVLVLLQLILNKKIRHFVFQHL